jgi:hypothetical protein
VSPRAPATLRSQNQAREAYMIRLRAQKTLHGEP